MTFIIRDIYYHVVSVEVFSINSNVYFNLNVIMAKNDNYVSSSSESDGSSDFENDEALTSVDNCSINHNGIPPTYFGNIDIKSSANIHFGNTAIYSGDVTVQQFVTPEQALQNLRINNAENGSYKTITQETPINFSTPTDTKINVLSNNNCSKVNPQLQQQLSVIVTRCKYVLYVRKL